jgi:hypothetical protein
MKSDEYTALRRELDTMLGIQAGQTALLTAMIQTHPRYEDLQLAATSALELQLGLFSDAALSTAIKDTARNYTEHMQRLQPLLPGAIQLATKHQLKR